MGVDCFPAPRLTSLSLHAVAYMFLAVRCDPSHATELGRVGTTCTETSGMPHSEIVHKAAGLRADSSTVNE
jgi:hypothetical protein